MDVVLCLETVIVAVVCAGLLTEAVLPLTKIGELPRSSPFTIYRRNDKYKGDNCISTVIIKRPGVPAFNDPISYDCVDEKYVDNGQKHTIVDGVIYSDQPDSVHVWLGEENCQLRDYADNRVKISDYGGEKCITLKTAIGTKTAIEDLNTGATKTPVQETNHKENAQKDAEVVDVGKMAMPNDEGKNLSPTEVKADDSSTFTKDANAEADRTRTISVNDDAENTSPEDLMVEQDKTTFQDGQVDIGKTHQQGLSVEQDRTTFQDDQADIEKTSQQGLEQDTSTGTASKRELDEYELTMSPQITNAREVEQWPEGRDEQQNQGFLSIILSLLWYIIVDFFEKLGLLIEWMRKLFLN